MLWLRVAGALVLIRHEGLTVTSLRVDSPVFQTSDSLGVGTSIGKFRFVRGIRVAKAPDSPYAVLLDRRRCGVAYELSSYDTTAVLDADQPTRGDDLVTWPDSVVVRAITVAACPHGARDPGMDSVSEAAPDSVPPVAVTAPIPMSAATPSASPPLTSDTGGIAPTTQELTELRAMLDVPVRGVIASQLRDTYSESRGDHPHDALDIPAPRGTAVTSAADGRVLKLFNSQAGGLMVYATDASERFILLYGHLDRYEPGLIEGARVVRGQVLGAVGTTGNAPPGTPHLHFAILRGAPAAAWWRGVAVNPYPLLAPPKSR
jgi:murein DD-endopeptidase MepM/ murein hydrolase activator NlpD